MELLVAAMAGISFLLFLIHLRGSDKARWVAFYWGSLLIGGIAILWDVQQSYVLIALLPAAIRVITRYWFLQSQTWDSLVLPFITLIAFWVVNEVSELVGYLLIAYVFVEIYLTISYFNRIFKPRGIGLFAGSGKRLDWYRIFLLSNLLMLAGITALYLPGVSSKLTLIIQSTYGLTIILGVIRYSNPTNALKPFFEEQKYAKSNLDEKRKFQILQALETELSSGFHLDSNASLKTLAKTIGTSTHQLSQVINETREMSFFELLAYYRVRDAKKLLRSPDLQHIKIEDIGERVGYLSKSAFNTAFKKIAGKTPSEYRDGEVREDKVERLKHREIPALRDTRSTFEEIKNSMIMFSNFLKVYFRNLKRNRIFTLVNLSGLILGFVSCLLIYMYLKDEFSYDKFHESAENIYRITLQATNPQTRTPHPMAQALVNDFPEVISAVTLTPLYGPGLTLQSRYIRNPENNTMFRVSDGFAADSTFFDVFSFPLVAGDEKMALKSPGSVVITESMARRFFGSTDVLGKRLEAAEDGSSGLITGIMVDPPKNSHFHPNYIIPYTTLKADSSNNRWMSWSDPGHFNYIRLAEGADHKKLEKALSDWVLKYSDGVEKELVEAIKEGYVYFGIQPIVDIHLTSHLRWELEANSSIMYVYILAGTILFILIIVAINFINLYTARSMERANEVGIRKTLGATERTIAQQFISESLMTCLFAWLIAFGLAALLLQYFNEISGKSISYKDLLAADTLLFSLAVVALIGLISGLYPAVSIGRVKAIEVMKGKFVNQQQGAWKRNVLITVQFTVSAILIFGSIVILRQVEFLESQPLGFEKEHLLVMELHTNEERQSREAIKNELNKISGVMATGGISNVPGGQFNQNDLYLEGNPFERVPASELWVDFDGLQALGIELAMGRWFDRSSQMDSTARNYIVNETAFKQLNLEDVNSQVMWNWESGARKGTIVGVMKDFNFKSLHEPVKPIVVTVGLGALNNILIRIKGQNVNETIQAIEKIHQQFDAQFAADISFMDDRLERLYQSERRAFQVFNIFAVIALILASMGLLGIAYLVITQRTKEIGIRKVLGARVMDLLWMENKAFIKIIGIAVILGLPGAFLIMQQWLTEFAYYTSIGFLPFLVTVITLLAVAFFSVSLAILQTIIKNPSQSLRYE